MSGLTKYAASQSSLQNMIAARFPKVRNFRVEHNSPNVEPVEYHNGLRTAREYPPVACWSVGDEQFRYVAKPTFQAERWSVPFFSGTTTKATYDRENDTLLKLLRWSSEGKTAREINSLLHY